MPSKCTFCKAHIVWKSTPEGKKIPLYPIARDDGALILDSKGHVVKARPSDKVKFRSHLLDCEKLRTSLYKRTRITLGKDPECDADGCTAPMPHYHCFKCGRIGHWADACTWEDEVDDEVEEANAE